MSNSTKLANPMKVITGKDTRWSYANVWEAKSINGGAPKFSVSLIIPKSDTATVQKIKAAIKSAYEEGQAKSSKATAAPFRPLRRSRRHFATAIPKDHTIRHMRTAGSLTPTRQPHPALSTRTAIRSSPVPRCTAAFTAELRSTSMHSTPTATKASPAV